MAKAVELAKKANVFRTAGYGTQRLYHFSKARAQAPDQKIPTLNDLKLRYRVVDGSSLAGVRK